MKPIKFYVRFALGPMKADIHDIVIKAPTADDAKDLIRIKHPGVDIYWLDVDLLDPAQESDK